MAPSRSQGRTQKASEEAAPTTAPAFEANPLIQGLQPAPRTVSDDEAAEVPAVVPSRSETHTKPPHRGLAFLPIQRNPPVFRSASRDLIVGVTHDYASRPNWPIKTIPAGTANFNVEPPRPPPSASSSSRRRGWTQYREASTEGDFSHHRDYRPSDVQQQQAPPIGSSRSARTWRGMTLHRNIDHLSPMKANRLSRRKSIRSTRKRRRQPVHFGTAEARRQTSSVPLSIPPVRAVPTFPLSRLPRPW